MHRPFKGLLVAAALALAATGLAGALAACGSTESTAQAQTVPAGASQAGGQQGAPSALFKQALDALVTKGTITSAQEEAVVTALASAMANGRPSGSVASPGAQPTPGVTPAPGATPPSGAMPAPGATPVGGAGPSAMFSSALDALVKDGTITSAQKTAIVDALGAAMPGAPQSGQPPSGGSSAQTS